MLVSFLAVWSSYALGYSRMVPTLAIYSLSGPWRVLTRPSTRLLGVDVFECFLRGCRDEWSELSPFLEILTVEQVQATRSFSMLGESIIASA